MEMNKLGVREICGTKLNTVTHGWALRGNGRLQYHIKNKPLDTHNIIRSQVLYPAELWARAVIAIGYITPIQIQTNLDLSIKNIKYQSNNTVRSIACEYY